MTTGWKTAFLRKGESDFKIYAKLKNQQEIEPCHYLHYLQMAAEKIGKSLTCPNESIQPPENHYGLTKWLKHAKAGSAHQGLMKICKIKKKADFRAYLQGLIHFALQIECLAPAIAKKHGSGPNAEYPWQDPRSAIIHIPADHPFSGILESPKYIKLVRFIEASIDFGKLT